MIKSLLTSVALVATVLTANAEKVELWSGNYSHGANYNWDVIIVEASEFASLPSEDVEFIFTYSIGDEESYGNIQLLYQPAEGNSEVLPISTEDKGVGNPWNWIQLASGINQTRTLTFSAEDMSLVKAGGMYVFGYNVSVTKIEVETDAEPKDPNLLWEGDAFIKGWEGVQSAPISASKLKVGDVLEYTISDPGTNAQLIVKSEINGWADLIGTAKFGSNDLAKGKVLVGVTQEMLDNCGNTIFLQGDGGATVTKVYRHEAVFDAENVLAYGNRTFGANVYVTIPEDVKYVNATITNVPEWLQLCNSGWTEIAQPVNRIYTAEDAPVTYQFEATPELVSAINEKKEVIFNGGGAEFLSLSVGNELILDYDVEKLKRVESVEDVPASYSAPLDIAYEEFPGLGKGSQLVITYTRGTTDLDLGVYAIVEGSEPMQITGYYPPYGTSYVIIPLTEEQVVAISKGALRIEGHDMIINKIYYSEGEAITGIADITVDENAPVEYFNLQGIKISADDATNGIFIRRQGGKSVKVAR